MKIPPEFPENVLERIIDSEKATVGTVYTTQVAYALVDMSLHNRQFTRNPADVVEKRIRLLVMCSCRFRKIPHLLPHLGI